MPKLTIVLFLSLWTAAVPGLSGRPGPVPDPRAVEALRGVFGDSIGIRVGQVALKQEEKDSILRSARTGWRTDTLSVLVCTAGSRIEGYGFVDDVKGKTQFITYLAALKPDGTVADIGILAYRESYGGEIAYESFRRQFRGKSAGDNLAPGRDIRNISGATISVRAVTLGVKRILATFQLLRGRIG